MHQNNYSTNIWNSGFGASTPPTSNTPTFSSLQRPNMFQTPNSSSFNGPSPQTNFGTNPFGQQPQPSTSQNKSSFGFGSTSQSGLFRQQSGSSLLQSSTPNQFGSSAFSNQTPGTVVKFLPTIGTLQDNRTSLVTRTKLQCVTCMKEYENKSLEELRFEDYTCNRKGPQEQSGFGQVFPAITSTTPAYSFSPKPSVFMQAQTPSPQITTTTPTYSFSSKPSVFMQAQTPSPQTTTTTPTFSFSSKPSVFMQAQTPSPQTTTTTPTYSFTSKPSVFMQAQTPSLQTTTTTPTFSFSSNPPPFLQAQTPSFVTSAPSIFRSVQTSAQNTTTAQSTTGSWCQPSTTQFPNLFQGSKPCTTSSESGQTNLGKLPQPSVVTQPLIVDIRQPSVHNMRPTVDTQQWSVVCNTTQQPSIVRNTTTPTNSSHNLNQQQPQFPPPPQDPNEVLLLASDSFPVYLDLDPVFTVTETRTTKPSDIKVIFDNPKKENKFYFSPSPKIAVSKPRCRDIFEPSALRTRHKCLCIRKLRTVSSSTLIMQKNELLKEAEKCLNLETKETKTRDFCCSFPTPVGSNTKLVKEKGTSTRVKDKGTSTRTDENKRPNPAGVILTRKKYYMYPDLEDLHQYMNENGECIVKGFTIGRKGYGNVYFPDPIDIANMNMDEIVYFRHREVTVYPDDAKKPPVGEGLNRRAQVTLDRIYPRDKETREYITDVNIIIASNFVDKLMQVTLKHNTSFVDYRPSTGSWVFNVKHFSKYGISESGESIIINHREINTILGDIIDHITPDRSYEQFYNQLKHVVENIVLNIQDFEALLVMDNFLPLIDLFQEESVRVEVCKKVLIGSNNGVHFVNDPVVVNALMFLCSILHDSVNALTPDDEYRQIGDILCHVIKTIDYGRDFEQQLTFYVEARGMFSNIDVVFVQLVQCVNSLSVKTRQIVKGLHTRKTGDFVRACAAYCFITIPSIKSVKHRLRLYLLSGQVALFNQCLGQADACFKAAANTISENDKSQFPESELILYVKQFLSLLLVVPDNPECSVLSLTRSVLNVLQGYSWESGTSLIGIYLSVIDMLSVMAQEWYPYHIDKVESNDSLYGSDKKFVAEVNKLCSVVTGEMMSKLKALGPCTKQSLLSIELFVRVAVRNDLTDQTMVLALNLWNLAIRDSSLDKKYLMRTRDYLKKRSFSCNNTRLQDLVEKME